MVCKIEPAHKWSNHFKVTGVTPVRDFTVKPNKTFCEYLATEMRRLK